MCVQLTLISLSRVHYFRLSEIDPLGLAPGHVPVRVRLAEEGVMQGLGLVRISKKFFK